MTKKTKTIGRRIFGLVMVLALMLTTLLPSLTVSAEEGEEGEQGSTSASTSVSTIDDSKKGSLTIYKYDGDALSDSVVEGLSDSLENLDATDLGLSPLEGVVFSYLKVGDIAQGTTDSGTSSSVTIGYSITNSTLLELLKSTGKLAEAFTDNDTDTTYYTSTSLNDALSTLSESDVTSFISEQSATKMKATDVNGKTEVTDLAVGLYLIVETDYPSTVTTTTAPFFVSIPMTMTSDDVDAWEYDVVAYPKNSTKSITIDKSVVEDGDETKYIDGEIGQNKQFVIRADVPSLIASMKKYTITDTLSDGLTFYSDSAPVVRAINAEGKVTPLTEGTEYTFAQSEQTLTFDFTCSRLDGYTQIEITYYAYLNKDAVVGGDGNSNDVVLEYSTTIATDSGTSTVEPTTLPVVYTYAIEVQKQFDGAKSNDASQNESVTFELQDESGNTIDVACDAEEGYYYVKGNNSVESAIITADSNGQIDLRGLEAGTYYLVETGTADGYTLLADRIEIVITSNEGSYTQAVGGTFAQYEDDKTYYADYDSEAQEGSTSFILPENVGNGKWVNFGTSTVYDSDGEQVTMYAPDELTWSATVAGEEVIATGTSVERGNGTVSFVVNNQKSGFELPTTGGSGTFWFLVVGGVVAAAAIVVIAVVTRKKKEGAEIN